VETRTREAEAKLNALNLGSQMGLGNVCNSVKLAVCGMHNNNTVDMQIFLAFSLRAIRSKSLLPAMSNVEQTKTRRECKLVRKSKTGRESLRVYLRSSLYFSDNTDIQNFTFCD
jgi:hypothetical protein